MTTLVSVIIPCLNAEQLLPTALESVLAQTHRALDVIVVDNGSTDRSVEIATAMGAPVRVVRADARGVGRARNAGLASAVGDYVAFLDADDVLEPTAIERRLAEFGRRDADVVWGAFWSIRDDGTERVRHMEPAVSGVDLAAELIGPDGWVQIGAMMFRRVAIPPEVRFIDGATEDVRFALDLHFAGLRFVRMAGDSGLLFREHDAPREYEKSSWTLGRGIAANARCVEDRWRALAAMTPRRARVLAECYLNAARMVHQREPALARELALHAFALDGACVHTMPTALRLATRVVGYPAAERVLAPLRRLRDWRSSIVVRA